MLRTKVSKLVKEIVNVFRCMEVLEATKWGGLLFLFSPKVIREGSLGRVDEAFGSNLRFRTGDQKFSFEQCSVGLVREIIGNECYIPAHEMKNFRNILDLGANCGVFTAFALANSPKANVVAVEAQSGLVEVAKSNISRSRSFSSRVEFFNAYVGEENAFIRQLTTGSPDVDKFSPEGYIAKVGICDFLKCDVEGAEYDFITPSASWLRAVRRISLEYQGTWSDGEGLAKILESHGFQVMQQEHGILGYLHGVRSSEVTSKTL